MTRNIAQKLNEAWKQPVAIDLGFQPVAMSVADTENFIRADVERWAKIIREANIKAD